MRQVRTNGESESKYIDIIKPVLTDMAGTGKRLDKK